MIFIELGQIIGPCKKSVRKNGGGGPDKPVILHHLLLGRGRGKRKKKKTSFILTKNEMAPLYLIFFNYILPKKYNLFASDQLKFILNIVVFLRFLDL